MSSTIPAYIQDILFDPQTSGGLLISVLRERAELLLNKLKQNGVKEAAIVGEVVAEPKGIITVK
jgi:selenide,water dikinase